MVQKRDGARPVWAERPIDMVLTGKRLKRMTQSAGYDVRFLQEYLCLGCPQSIYRWFEGKSLPSVDHLHALSVLLQVHMEDLLALQGESEWIEGLSPDAGWRAEPGMRRRMERYRRSMLAAA